MGLGVLSGQVGDGPNDGSFGPVWGGVIRLIESELGWSRTFLRTLVGVGVGRITAPSSTAFSLGCGPVFRGGTYPHVSASGRPFVIVTDDGRRTARGTESWCRPGRCGRRRPGPTSPPSTPRQPGRGPTSFRPSTLRPQGWDRLALWEWLRPRAEPPATRVPRGEAHGYPVAMAPSSCRRCVSAPRRSPM